MGLGVPLIFNDGKWLTQSCRRAADKGVRIGYMKKFGAVKRALCAFNTHSLKKAFKSLSVCLLIGFPLLNEYSYLLSEVVLV